jgi:hypothetical protein
MFDISLHQPGRVFMAVFKYRDNDFSPYIFRTNDYGQSWDLLTTGKNGIPKDYFIRAVREDPDLKGLLYAGTEFGMFISFDDGRHWQAFQLNLPVTPITDMMVYRKDLVLATQGRAFWILDDIGLLHQIQQTDLNNELILYTPENPYRTQERGILNKLSVYAYLKEKPEKACLEILDAQDNVVHTLKEIKPKKGLNHFSWDLTHEPPEKIKEAVISLSYIAGSMAVPGKYMVRLKADDFADTKDFEVLKDPRWTKITVDDLQEQFELQTQVGQAFTKSHDLIKNVRAIRDQVKDISSRAVKAGYSEDIKTAAKELSEKLKALEDSLIQTKNESGQDAINYQVKLDNHLAYLYSFVHEQDSKPNKSIQDRYNELKAQLDKAAQDYQTLVDTDLHSFTKLLDENDIPRIIIKKKTNTK